MRTMSLLLAMAVTAAAACSSPQNSTVANNAPATTAAGPVDITFTTDPAEPKMGDNTFQVMVMQAGLGLSRGETIVYAKSVVDIVVQLERSQGERRIGAIMVNRPVPDNEVSG